MPVTEVTPLESSPEAINDLLQKVGVTSVKAIDVFTFDDVLPKPQHALLLCYPDYKKVEEIMKPLYDSATNPSDVFFISQKIKNACGTFALFNALANLKVCLGDGIFSKWLVDAKTKDTEARSDLLAANEEIIAAHESAAKSGNTQHSGTVEHHYVCYVNVDGKLYQIDSRAPFPLQVGTTTDETLVKDAGSACQNIISKLDNVSFAALALVPN